MFSDPLRVADAINNPRFRPGDHVMLIHGPHKFTRGMFLNLKPDVEWAAIEESSGTIRAHPVEWMQSDAGNT